MDLPCFPAVEGPGALPMRGVRSNVRPREARSNLFATLVTPFCEKVDLPVAEGPFPQVKVAGLEAVGPRVLPFAAFPVEGSQAEAFQGTSVIDPFEALQRDEPIQRPRSGQRPWRFHPPLLRGNAADGVPLSFQKVELAFRFHAVLRTIYRNPER